MNTRNSLLAVVGTLLMAFSTTQCPAQFTILHAFTGDATPPYGGSEDGAIPYGSVVLGGNTLYGMTHNGGSNGVGTVFKVNTDGSGYSVLLHFGGAITPASPFGTLTLYSNTLYGITSASSGGWGSVFKITTNGTGFSVLHTFQGYTDGSQPRGSLILDGSTLWGMSRPYINIGGTVFRINTGGSGFQVVHAFGGSSDGSDPYGSLTLVGTTLYGMTAFGGTGDGTLFCMNTDGSGFQILHSFNCLGGDGCQPWGNDLTLVGANLFGMTAAGGVASNCLGGGGTLFKIGTNGSDYTVLHQFACGTTEGIDPYGSLVVSGSTLYGTTQYGGVNTSGTVFRIYTDGSGLEVLHAFAGGANDGARPYSGSPVLSGQTLYGSTQYGGAGGGGVVYSLTIPASTATISLLPTSLSQAVPEGQNATNMGFRIWNSGGGTLHYSIAGDQTWLTVNQATGNSTGQTNTHTISFNTASLTAGTYNASITITADATNSPQAFGVTVTVVTLCDGLISPSSVSCSSDATNGSITVTEESNCGWTAVSDAGWITFTSESGGIGSGTVIYSVAVNTNTSARTGTIAIAGQIFTVIQACASLGTQWTQATGLAPWRGRVTTAVAFNGRLWILGGSTTAGYTNDVWNSLDGISWNMVTNSAPWSARWLKRRGAVVFNNKIWIAGGEASANRNDVWCSSDGLVWSNVTNAAPWSPRAPDLVVHSNAMWIIGGRATTDVHDIWKSPDGTNWTMVTSAAAWPTRVGYATFSFANKLWVMGGQNSILLNDVWSSMDGSNWVQETAAPIWNPRRPGATFVYDGKVWLVGGEYSLNTLDTNDVWVSVNAISWTQVASQIAQPLASHAWRATAVHSNALWLLGGGPLSGNRTNDAWYSSECVVCTYSISPNEAVFNAGATNATISVTTGDGCPWTATNNIDWLTVTSGSSGIGNGTVNYSVSANTNMKSRVGKLTIAGQTFSLTQAGLDSVGDGIPDWWRQHYFGGTGSTTNILSCASCDPDGDGMSNLQEFLTGTDATNSVSFFSITSIVITNEDLRVIWTTGVGRTNALERNTDNTGGGYSNNFAAIFTVTNTTGTTTDYLDVSAATNSPSHFYRVRQVP